MDFTKLALVYVHLIACCVALGAILWSDSTMVVRLLQGRGQEPGDHMDAMKTVITAALAILWATGLFFIWRESAASSLAETLSNPKLEAKIIVVSVLTLNGLILHYSVLPLLSRAGSVFGLDNRQRAFAILVGALSGVSWMYAAFLGIARPLSWKYPLADILMPYPVLFTAVFTTVWLLTSRAVRQTPAF